MRTKGHWPVMSKHLRVLIDMKQGAEEVLCLGERCLGMKREENGERGVMVKQR